MATEVEDVAISFGNLNIARDSPQNTANQIGYPISDSLVSFQDDVEKLAETAEVVNIRAQSIKPLIEDAVPGTLSITEIYSLHESTKKFLGMTENLRTTVDTLREVTESSIIIHLRSLGEQTMNTVRERLRIEELFSHFEMEIRSIIRQKHVLWKVAEECYMQATSRSGTLYVSRYLDSPQKDGQKPLLDHDSVGQFHSMDIGEEHGNQADSMKMQSWVNFWAMVLSKSPDGPTLFYPPLSPNSQALKIEDAPTYLFRTFVEASPGPNDDSVITSAASRVELPGNGRIDLLQLERTVAADCLETHLHKGLFDVFTNDNLMSWTSSLLFAIQYAIYRGQWPSPGDIKICVVDTREFPQGQFAQDLWLFEAIESTTLPQGPARKFFEFRQETPDFYNGEYLSQGTVNIANRSCITSLKSLKDAGLSELYPEFDDPEGTLHIARKCFDSFAPVDVAAVLLTFKLRKIRKPQPENLKWALPRRPKWAKKPAETRRYWTAARFCDGLLPVEAEQTSSLDQEKAFLRRIWLP
ncbi:hypothetical protein GT037_005631 [Alternaria burnsii]|uniref:DUF7587 domain-containing protein n=1 Tax=Alternaria burnsii TaxID=1187904 RepID=A0A8H7B6N1_9PLEO|nr:uncharacterized protein GT037_005631 [Alternaria burnsii]KAF7676126.1 hypothetical protein GT037_005631 [Alternaria burnsii]